MLLVDLIEANPKTRFILFHGGFPWVGETGVILEGRSRRPEGGARRRHRPADLARQRPGPLPPARAEALETIPCGVSRCPPTAWPGRPPHAGRSVDCPESRAAWHFEPGCDRSRSIRGDAPFHVPCGPQAGPSELPRYTRVRLSRRAARPLHPGGDLASRRARDPRGLLRAGLPRRRHVLRAQRLPDRHLALEGTRSDRARSA